MFSLILQSLWFFLPAYLANMAPPLFKKWNLLNGLAVPINKRLFGKNKTYRGILAAVLFGMLIFIMQKFLYDYGFIKSIALFDYNNASVILGFLLGFGAIFGDLIKSFLKRRLGIEPGKPFIPFDQLDFVVGALLFSSVIYAPPLKVIISIIIISPLLHLLVNRIGYYLHITRKY